MPSPIPFSPLVVNWTFPPCRIREDKNLTRLNLALRLFHVCIFFSRPKNNNLIILIVIVIIIIIIIIIIIDKVQKFRLNKLFAPFLEEEIKQETKGKPSVSIFHLNSDKHAIIVKQQTKFLESS